MIGRCVRELCGFDCLLGNRLSGLWTKVEKNKEKCPVPQHRGSRNGLISIRVDPPNGVFGVISICQFDFMTPRQGSSVISTLIPDQRTRIYIVAFV